MRILLAALLVLAGCSGRIRPIDPIPDAGCGDGLINAMLGEECEGSDLNGATCQSLGFDEGSLSCSECKLVKTLCVKRCGNGVIDTGEACDKDAGVIGCSDFGYVSCTAQCQLDRSHCVTNPYQPANGVLNVMYGGVTALTDLQPRGFGDLLIVVGGGRDRIESSAYTVQMGFLSSTSKYDFGGRPVQAIGQALDIVALNVDGTLDRYAFDGGSFTRRPFPDAGCSGVIVGDLGGGAVATSSCDAGEVLVWGAFVTRAPSNGGTCSLADFDRNGSVDVLSVSGAQLDVHAAPSFVAFDAGVLPVALTSVQGADFDADGDLDLAGIASGSVKLLENTGATGFADRLTIPAAGAHSLRVGDLDLDGRVDFVWESGDKAFVRRNQGAWVFAPYEATFGSGLGAARVETRSRSPSPSTSPTENESAAPNASISYTQLNRVR